MNFTTLRAQLAQFPHLALANYPTPLEPLPRFSKSIGANVWIKRDDNIGPGLGGNKTRKLEFLMAEAQRCGAHKVVTFGGLQSNHARITAAVARKLGIEPHLFYFEKRPRDFIGNLQLNTLLNAKMHFLPLAGDGRNDLQSINRLVRLFSRAMVGPSYFIPVGGHNALGCLGYVDCAAEIDVQVKSLGLENVIVVTAVGTGGTLAGLHAGSTLLDSPVRVIGIDVGKLWTKFPHDLAHLTGEITALLGERRTFAARDIPMIEDRYCGRKYGVPSQAGTDAIKRLAETEGIVLDPVYTGKAMAGLIDLVRRGFFKSDETVIFLHTGGAPGLFAFP
ncbi:MAG: D-cysteine desulfhydrase family protein [Chloroflexi bacterium]|nr:D-cysteine desulfhydrase family protein [Chloroflexota bacterium]